MAIPHSLDTASLFIQCVELSDLCQMRQVELKPFENGTLAQAPTQNENYRKVNTTAIRRSLNQLPRTKVKIREKNFLWAVNHWCEAE
jgi:hypothetical protein